MNNKTLHFFQFRHGNVYFLISIPVGEFVAGHDSGAGPDCIPAGFCILCFL
jgi:hypothetical protein